MEGENPLQKGSPLPRRRTAIMLLIVTATEREMHSALASFGAPPSPPQGAAGFWRAAGRDLALLVTGVGMVNAALALGGTLAGGAIDGVVNVGVAGSYDIGTLGLGSTAVAGREIWPEYGLERAAVADARALGFPLWGERDAADAVWQGLDLTPDADAARMGLTPDAGWPRCVSLSVSAATTSRERTRELRAACGAELENMEGFALAYGAFRAGLPFLELRAVSNRVGSRAAADWDLRGAFAALEGAMARLLG